MQNWTQYLVSIKILKYKIKIMENRVSRETFFKKKLDLVVMN